MGGAAIGVVGGLVACYAILIASFWGFAGGMLMMGLASSFTQQYRFAAADQGTETFKPKAISWVLAGGVVAAILGPAAAVNFSDLFAPIEFAGAFVAASCLMLAAIFVLAFLRFDKPMSRKDRRGGRQRSAAGRDRAATALSSCPCSAPSVPMR